jgi:hypothetical protein
MKNIILFFIISTLYIGCSTEANIKIINRTDNNLYFGFDGDNYILEGSEDEDTAMEFSFDTGTKSIFSEKIKKVNLYLEGETFLMQLSDPYGAGQGAYYTETELELKQDETRKIYCDPTHAGVKVINDFDQMIRKVKYTANNLDTLYTVITDLDIDEFDFYQLKYYSLGDTIWYSFQVEFNDGTINSYGGEGNLLEKDEVFLINSETEVNY